MRICYLVLVHHKFDQAARMIRRLAGPNCGFVLHIDRNADPESIQRFRADLRSIDGIVYARCVRVRWGSYAQALAIMRSIQAAVGRPERYDRYVLLSGQDYPIVPRWRIDQSFRDDPQSEYVEAYALNVMDDAPGWSPYYRFRRYHLFLGRFHRALPYTRKGPPPQAIYHGSTWWALTHPALEFIAREFKNNSRLRRYLRTSFLVDEAYVPTLLMGSPFRSRVAGHNLTYAKWTPTSGPHPKTLGIEDLPSLGSSSKLFARKFDADVDSTVLDELDRLHAQEHTHPKGTPGIFPAQMRTPGRAGAS
jgi:Core-2/I-Branching enzyme